MKKYKKKLCEKIEAQNFQKLILNSIEPNVNIRQQCIC